MKHFGFKLNESLVICVQKSLPHNTLCLYRTIAFWSANVAVKADTQLQPNTLMGLKTVNLVKSHYSVQYGKRKNLVWYNILQTGQFVHFQWERSTIYLNNCFVEERWTVVPDLESVSGSESRGAGRCHKVLPIRTPSHLEHFSCTWVLWYSA